MVVAKYPGEWIHVPQLKVVAVETQRHQAAAVHRVDLRGVPEGSTLAGIYPEGGIPVQGIQAVLLSLMVQWYEQVSKFIK